MDEDLNRSFKMLAVSKGISMKELFEECFHYYVKSHRSK